jgi:hypothetical protein
MSATNDQRSASVEADGGDRAEQRLVRSRPWMRRSTPQI